MDSTASTSGSGGALGAAKEQAGSIVEQAKTTVTDSLEERKDYATEFLDDASEALHETADALRQNDHDAFARYAESAAEQVANFTGSIRGKSVGDLLDEAERFARRDPGLFLGGAFVLGIFGARFLKASAPQRMGGMRTSSPRAYQGDGGYGAPRVGTRGMAGSGSMGSGSMGAGSTGTGMPSGASRVESRTGTPRLPSPAGGTGMASGGSGAGTSDRMGGSGSGSTGGGVPGSQRSGQGPSGTGSTGGGVPGSNA